MMPHRYRPLIVLALGLAAQGGRCATIVVDQWSPSAQDSNPGTRTQPLRTIARAAALAQAGDTVIVRPGFYRETVHLDRSGTAAKPITFQAERPWTVYLSDGPRQARWNPSENPILFGATRRDPKSSERWSGADYITVRGFVFQNARGTAVAAGTGWRIEDCVVDHANFDGIVPRGDDIALVRCVVQDCGNNGMAGGFGSNITVRDCVLRRCNQWPNSPGGNAGACKFLITSHMTVENVISYDHVGTGWWLDWDNTDYRITGGTFFGCHAGRALENGKEVDQPWAAAGIWVEGSAGPGLIAGNTLYSNVSGGIGVLDSPNVAIQDNLIVDCGGCIEFRDLQRDDNAPEEKRTRRVANERLSGNRFKAWRDGAAIATSIGEFKRGPTPPNYGVMADLDTFDPLPGKPLVKWLDVTTATLKETNERLGIEYRGKVAPVAFRGHLIATHSTGEAELKSIDPDRFRQVPSQAAERLAIDEAIGQATVGKAVVIPVFGRYDVVRAGAGGTCEVYDLARHRHARLTLPDAKARAAFEQAVTRYAVLRPTWLRVKLTRRDPYRIEGVFLGVTKGR